MAIGVVPAILALGLSSLGRSKAAPSVKLARGEPDRIPRHRVREQAQGRGGGEAQHRQHSQCESLTGVHTRVTLAAPGKDLARSR